MPIDNGEAKSWIVPAGQTLNAQDGRTGRGGTGRPKGRLGLPRRASRAAWAIRGGPVL